MFVLLFYREVFNALNCTPSVLRRKLLVINVTSKHKLICVCVALQMKYVTLMFLRAYRAAGLRVITRKDSIDIEIKEIALVTAWSELNLNNT
jgi:hypothetical protein